MRSDVRAITSRSHDHPGVPVRILTAPVRLVGLALVVVAFAVAAPRTAGAAHGGPHGDGAPMAREEGRDGGHWGHGDIRRFRDHDFDRWRAGHWIHGEHLGRLGWWWVVDGSWLYYPAPVYPYPDPYAPPP